MSGSTGPILAAGALVAGNAIIVQNKPPNSQTKVLVGSLIAVAGLSIWEKAMPRTAVAFSWLVLASTMLVRVDPATPAPLESFQQWYNQK